MAVVGRVGASMLPIESGDACRGGDDIENVEVGCNVIWPDGT